jgi:hypothetical protein
LMKITSLLMCFLRVPNYSRTYLWVNECYSNNAIDEHLVYKALRELGFEPKRGPLVYFGTSNEKIIYNQPIGWFKPLTKWFYIPLPLLKTWKLLKIQGMDNLNMRKKEAVSWSCA